MYSPETQYADVAASVRAEAEHMLLHEARLLDEFKLEAWLQLFTVDGLYWVPIDDAAPIASQAALIYDPPLRREERVYHLLHTGFPAQTPRSRTVHVVSNILVEAKEAELFVSSSQIVYEMRPGDIGQAGIGEVMAVVARVDYVLRRVDGRLQIAEKKILLINRDTWQGNLTFMI